ncbi:MAG: type II toxin-antitoxin system VapC family toxin [Spirochaetes bacterium]|nr:type II toxin-antitoxin system VapC family toxin [Spirochaetota bacterium]MBX3721758.1 type II toxin-antitoxin system VapC family toxin [Turneriella sp.]
MKYILDTNICIQILRGSSQKVKEKISMTRSVDIAIPSIVRFELLYGAYKSSHPEKKLKIIRDFIGSFTSIPVNDQIADKCGEIRATLEKAGTPIGPYDLLIAATAVTHETLLVTHNVKEFSRVPGIQLEDWE